MGAQPERMASRYIAAPTSGNLDHSSIDLRQQHPLPFAVWCQIAALGVQLNGCRVADMNRRVPNCRPPSEFLRDAAPPRWAGVSFETDEGE
jgi:hypothetical protein